MKIKNSIEKKLTLAFQPSVLEVINESHQHSVPLNSETHFKVVIVCEKFRDLSLVQRHRKVYDELKQEMTEGVHALSVHPMTPEEYERKSKDLRNSPPCLGGSKKD